MLKMWMDSYFGLEFVSDVSVLEPTS